MSASASTAIPTVDQVPLAAPAASRGDAARDRAARVRVVHCIDNLGIGGTELNALRTLERLDRTRFDIALVTLREEGPLRARYEAAGIPVHPFPVRSLFGPEAIAAGLRFARFLRARETQIVHSHDIYTNIFATAWARVAGVPVVIASRRWWQSLPQRKYRVGNQVAYRLAHRVLANSPAVAGSLADADGVAPARILTVPNFADEAAFRPMSRAERARRREAFGVPADALVVGMIARLSAEKDHVTLLDAMSRLTGPAADAHLLLVGDGPMRAALEARAATLGIAPRVHFAGLQPNEPNLHPLFDLSTLTSLSEGFPNTIVEAMAAARPVVATAVGGVPDAVAAGRTGTLVPPGDAAALARAMDALLADRQRREAFGSEGQAEARRKFHASAVIPMLEAHYESLAAASCRP